MDVGVGYEKVHRIYVFGSCVTIVCRSPNIRPNDTTCYSPSFPGGMAILPLPSLNSISFI